LRRENVPPRLPYYTLLAAAIYFTLLHTCFVQFHSATSNLQSLANAWRWGGGAMRRDGEQRNNKSAVANDEARMTNDERSTKRK